jgi:hypothetical protein
MSLETGRLHTNLDKTMENWQFEMNGKAGQINTQLRNNLNTWVYIMNEESIHIETYYADHYNHWQFSIHDTLYNLETQFDGIWTQWQLSGEHLNKLFISTAYGNSWDNWIMYRKTGQVVISTRLHDHFEDWEIEGSFANEHSAEAIATVFIPVFVARIQQKGLAR